MTETRHEERSEALVPGAHRVIRMLDAAEGPFRGALVTRGDAVAVSIDVDTHAGWEGWRFAGADHVAGPVDVMRRSHGHDVLLPWCTERVGSFLGRRAAAESAVTAGEVTTLVVSLLRGIGEIGAGTTQIIEGVWWLTDTGRPVFVTGSGDDPREGAAQIVAQLRDTTRDRALGRVLQVIHDGLRHGTLQPRIPPRLLEQWEGDVCQIAAPRPLQRDIHPPERARQIVSAASSRGAAVSRADGTAGTLSPTRGEGTRRGMRVREQGRTTALWKGSVAGMAVLRHLGARMLERLASGRVERSWTERNSGDASVPSRRPARRRSLIVAGAAAAAVITGGLLLPGGATGEAPSESQSGDGATIGTATAKPSPNPVATDAAAEVPTSTVEVTPGAEEPAASDDDPLVAAGAVFEKIEECRDAGDAVCTAAVAAGTTNVLDRIGSAGDWELALVDEYGDVAVIRMSPKPDAGRDARERMLVLVRVESKWLVRDVYDVADQP